MIKDISFELVENGEAVTYQGEVEYRTYKVRHGEDQDGNRWEWRYYDEVEAIQNITRNGVKIKEDDLTGKALNKFYDSI